MGYPELYRLGARQHGALLLPQFPTVGVPAGTARDRVTRERWDRPWPDQPVVFLPGSVPSFLRSASAALLAVGDHARLTKRGVLHLRGALDRSPDLVELVVPHDQWAPALAGVEVTRSRTLDGSCVLLSGLRCVTPERAICDLAAERDRTALRHVLIDARQRRVIRWDRLQALADELRGATGMPLLRELLSQLDAEVCDSELEFVVRKLLAPLRPDPAPVPVRIGAVTVHIDIGWSRYLVGVDCEGLGAHSSREQLRKDQRRRNALDRTRWSIECVDWDRAHEDQDGIVAAVATRLLERGWPGPPRLPR